MDIVATIITAFVGIIGVWLGSYLTTKNTIMIQKRFMVKQLRINKIQDVLTNLLEYLRAVGKMQNLVVKYEKKEMSHEEFKINNDMLQDEITGYFRFLASNRVFLSDVKDGLETLNDKYDLICNKIYEKYYNPQSRVMYFDEDQKTYDFIKLDFEQCLLFGDKVIQKLNKILLVEIDDLNK